MSEHRYLQTLRRTFPNFSDVEIELLVTADAELQKLTRHDEHYHRREGMKLLFPDRVWHPWRERLVHGYYRAKRAGKKELLFHGSSSSNKTGGMADLAVEIWLENPKATSIYITSPYEDATATGLWARILEQFDAARARHPSLPGKVKESEASIVMYDRNPLSFIKVVTVDQVGKLVGKKSQSIDAGMMIVMADEMPEFKRNGEALVGVLKNLRSVGNFMLIGAGNFADPNDLLGTLSEPAIEGGYESLDIDRDQEWETARGGLVIRFDGHQSPNVEAGEDKWPFVTTISYLKDLERMEGGTRTPGYYRYGRSFPMLDFSEFTVTNAAKIRAGNCYEAPEWSGRPFYYGAHCDPGFGGDPCILQVWRVGEGDVDDKWMDVFELPEPPLTIPVEVIKSDDPIERSRTMNRQIARRVKEELDKRRIPYRNFSFDDSMRGGITHAFVESMGAAVVPISSQGPATTRAIAAAKQIVDPNKRGEARKVKTAKDEYANYNTEMHFAVAMAIDGGQLRGLHLSRAAVKQLCTRKWEWGGAKKTIEKKASYKQRSSGHSPNESDALVGGMENARRLGFKLAGIRTRSGGAMSLLLDIQREADLRSLVNEIKGETLLPGQLHSMDSDNGSIRPHLHS